MRILSWMQQKINGKQISCKKSTAADTYMANYNKPKKERASEANALDGTGLQDWQHGLLTIGTFGNSEVDEKNKENREIQHNPPSAIQDLSEFSMEELGKLKKELTKYLALKNSRRDSQSRGSSRRSDFPLNKFLNCPSSLDVDRTSSLRLPRDSISESGDPENHYVVVSKGKDICSADDAGTRIKEKSFKFLPKNMFICQGGFVSAPSLRETQLLESRVDKLIRSILHRKVYHQNVASCKKITQRISTAKGEHEDASKEKEIGRCKWVKTDSDFIVLEMEACLISNRHSETTHIGKTSKPSDSKTCNLKETSVSNKNEGKSDQFFLAK